MVPPRPPDSFRSPIPILCTRFPNSHRIISFADPHLLTPFPSYRYKNHRGPGRRLSPRRSDLSRTSHSPYTLPSSVSSKSFACHSYATLASRTVLRDENCRGMVAFFPNWNSPLVYPERTRRATFRGYSRLPFQPSIDRGFRLGRKDPDFAGTVNFQLSPPLSPLSATLTTVPISIHSKALT